MHVWRERLQRWFTPLAQRFPLSPNAITIVALALNVTAAYLLYRRHFLPAIAFVAVGGGLDAFDGIVARVQGKTSRYGDVLDHFCDRVSDVLLIIGWLAGNAVRFELLLAVTVGVMFNGYIGTQVEATWHERRYDGVGRGEFVLALIVYPTISHLLITNGLDATHYATFTVAEWMAILLVTFAVVGIAQRFALARKLERGA
jgi:archaetidylinositol phosphate synthase